MDDSIFENNEIPDSLNYTGELLGLGTGEKLFDGMALAHVVSVMLDVGLHKEVQRCISYLEKISAESQVDEILLIADMNLMTLAAVCRDAKSFELHRRNVEGAIVSDVISPIVDVIPYYVLSSMARIPESISNLKSYTAEAVELFEQLSYFHDEIDDYGFTFMPVLQAVKHVLSEEQLINLTLNLLEYARTDSEKLEFYDFIIENCRLDIEKHAALLNNHYELLYNYHRTHADEKKQDIRNKLLSFKIERRFIKNASTDTLTGMGNRYAYKSALQQAQKELGLVERSKSKLVIVLADINGLKETNDTFGHQAGDELIKNAARALSTAFAGIGEVFRIGGDEFTIIVNATPKRFREAVDNLYALTDATKNTFDSKLYMAIGFAAAADNPNMNVDDLVDLADRHMYEDKNRFYEITGKPRR